MTDNVLTFKPRRLENVWECECGCQQFYILENMRIECASCSQLSNSVFVTDETPSANPD